MTDLEAAFEMIAYLDGKIEERMQRPYWFDGLCKAEQDEWLLRKRVEIAPLQRRRDAIVNVLAEFASLASIPPVMVRK